MKWIDPGAGRDQIVNEAGELVAEFCRDCGHSVDLGEPHLCEGWKPPPTKRSEPMGSEMLGKEMTGEEAAIAIQRLEDAGIFKRRKKVTSGIVLTTYGRELLKRWSQR